MLLGERFRRFVESSPVCVMVRGTLENLLSPAKLDELFERVAVKQYTRELLFSTLFRLMAEVVFKSSPSVRAAYQSQQEPLPVSITAVYDKLNGLEPQISAALVRESALAAVPVIEQLKGGRRPLLSGYRAKILDGNHLAGTEHRLEVLRKTYAAALPGQTLVVLDPERMLAIDVFPCEDGHAQERAMLDAVLPTVQADDLWIADRGFCTSKFLFGILQRRGSLVIRQHATTLRWETASGRGKQRATPDGKVHEQDVRLTDPTTGAQCLLRRVTLTLKEPTRDGEREIHVLTNVPRRDADAARIMNIYRERWTIEGVFQKLTRDLACEIDTLGYPRAALFGFCLALVAYNALAIVQAALRASLGEERVDELSHYYLALEMSQVYPGMMIALPAPAWKKFQPLTAKELAHTLRAIARHVRPEKYQRHPRGPKRSAPTKSSGRQIKHVSTARLIASG
jgi:IS4 transposase